MPEPTQSALLRLPRPVELSRLSLYQFFGPGGVLSQRHPAYEFRKGQLAMATAVEEAIDQKRHLIVEAGTGTGKTLAYLLPIIKSGKRVIVSTGTKNLQEQLFFKDVPFLERALFGEATSGEPRLKVCYMKGRGNYLCRKKLYDLTGQPILNGLDEINEFRTLLDWDKETPTGDRAELTTLPETSPLWAKLNASAEHCVGSKCSEFERCFITAMRRQAAESDIIIVNHHLFFADLSVKLAAEKAPDAGVLPSPPASSSTRLTSSRTLPPATSASASPTSRSKIFSAISKSPSAKKRSSPPISSSSPAASASARSSSSRCSPKATDASPSPTARSSSKSSAPSSSASRTSSASFTPSCNPSPASPTRSTTSSAAPTNSTPSSRFLMESHEKNTVYWIERRSGRGTSPKTKTSSSRPRPSMSRPSCASRSLTASTPSSSPPRPSPSPTASTTSRRASASTAPANSSSLRTSITSRRPSSTSRPTCPTRATPHFTSKAIQRIRQLLEITRGRAFCLFTSLAQMQQVHDALLGQLSYPMLLQGSAPKTALIEQFRATPNAVLFATSSFWQGVDVQGEQLSCVIIDKIPFAVPSDPIVQARGRAIDDSGGNSFFDYSVPAAVITLKQGFGRLIRSLNDRGLLVLLDSRILKKQYGKVFVQSLPAYTRTTDIRKVEEFFGCTHDEIANVFE